MIPNLVDAVVWLFVINLGIAFGAGLYEAVIVLPQWRTTPPSAWVNTGLRFWVYVTTIPLTLLTLASLILPWLVDGPRRNWWLAAAIVILLERIATFAFFIPTMMRLQTDKDLSPAAVRLALDHWMLMNHGRHVLTLAGWLLALRAVSLPANALP
jgi:hypothetical protein